MRSESFRKGVKDGIPIGLGYFAVSFTFGMMAVADGLSIWQAVSGEKRLSDQVQCNDLAGGETACLSGTVSEQHGTVDLDVSVPAA